MIWLVTMPCLSLVEQGQHDMAGVRLGQGRSNKETRAAIWAPSKPRKIQALEP